MIYLKLILKFIILIKDNNGELIGFLSVFSNQLLTQWSGNVALPGGAGWNNPTNVTFPISYKKFVNVITNKDDYNRGQNNQSWVASSNKTLTGFKFGCADTNTGNWLAIGY